jgi:IS5 family transposase
MQPKKSSSQRELFLGAELTAILNDRHPLFILANKIDWSQFDKAIDACYAADMGRPGMSTRLMVGLLYLKHAFDESDESVLERWLENPYWQYFCGFEYMQHELPVDPSCLSKWRSRVGAERLEKLLQATIQTALQLKALPSRDLERVNVDTTVQEKAIAFPTDARLYHKMRAALVRRALQLNIPLRQSYRFQSKRLLAQQGRYAHAQQYKRASKMTRQLKTILGRVVRDIQRKSPQTGGIIADEMLRILLARAERLWAQTKTSKQKLYSVHAPEVECISKGKAHKRYEFGCKASLIVTNKSNWITAAAAVHGNPYDGHTLEDSVQQMKRITGVEPQMINGDQHYRKHNYTGSAVVNIVGRIAKGISRTLRKVLKRRAAIEPTIGHLKSDNRLCRNHLKGKSGDQTNVILAAAGYNLRKLLRWIVFYACFGWLGILRRCFQRLNALEKSNPTTSLA